MSVSTAASKSWKAAWPNTWGFFWIKVGPASWCSVFLSGATFLSFSFHFWKMHLDCTDFSSCSKEKQRMIYGFLGILCKYREEENHSAHLSEDQAPILLLFTSLEVFTDLQWHQCFSFSWLWPNSFIILSKEGAVQQFLSAQRKMSLG